MSVFGFDLSSRKLAAVVLSDGEPVTFTHEPPKKEKMRAFVLAEFIEELESFFSRTMSPDHDNWVFVEHPLKGRAGVHATIVQAQVQGIVLGLSLLCGATGSYPVNVQTWKKEVVGHGGADKQQVRAFLDTHHSVLAGVAGEDQDLVDAACVAIYGQTIIERGSTLVAGG